MKIEVGKTYRTRNGLKAKVHEIYWNRDPYTVVHGSICYDNSTWISAMWALDGRATVGERDLAEEWTEPEPRRQAWVDSTGVLWLAAPGDPITSGATCVPWLGEPEAK
jgi:hypothetical protein